MIRVRVQSAEFIKKGSGTTDSGPVKNELGARALYLTVLSDGTPSLTVKVHTGNDPVNGVWFDSPINLLDGSVDAVIIAVPHPKHCEIAAECLRAGVHVLTEKPLDITVTAAKKRNIILFK